MSALPPPSRPTLRTIAQATGFSITCVSYALRNHPSIPPATRDKIKAAADRLGYRMAPAIAELMSHIRNARPISFQSVVAVVNPTNNPDPESEPSFQKMLIEGARERAHELGYKLEVHWLLAPRMTERRLAGILHARGVRGVIFPPFQKGGSRLQETHWARFSAIRVGFSLAEPRFHRVCPNLQQGALLAIERLRALGYRRIGMVLDESTEKRVRYQWSSIFHWYQQQIPERERVPLHLRPVREREPFLAWFRELRPDVVLVTDRLPYDWLIEAGVKVPRDVGVAMPGAVHNLPGAAGVDQDVRRIGLAAIEALVAQINRQETGAPRSPRTIMSEGFWVDGKTVRRVGAARPLAALIDA